MKHPTKGKTKVARQPPRSPITAAKYWLALCLLLLVAVLAVAVVSSNSSQTPTATATVIPAPPLIIGSPTAKITLVEYGDFHCSSCEQFFTQVEPQIRRNYIDTGKVKLEYRVYPWVSDDSIRAGEAAYCASDQNQFAAYHDLLYQNQGLEDATVFTPTRLKQFAATLGLNLSQFAGCYDSGKYAKKVENGVAEAHSNHVSSTPTFFIGTQKVVGAQSYATFKTLLDAKL